MSKRRMSKRETLKALAELRAATANLLRIEEWVVLFSDADIALFKRMNVAAAAREKALAAEIKAEERKKR